MIFNIDKNSKTDENYKLMAQTIIPRPIAWVVTVEFNHNKRKELL